VYTLFITEEVYYLAAKHMFNLGGIQGRTLKKSQQEYFARTSSYMGGKERSQVTTAVIIFVSEIMKINISLYEGTPQK
jgi:hypothetical protein